MKKFSVFLAAIVLAGSFSSLQAQSPSEMMGIGVFTGHASGGQVAYALSPAMHIGAMLALSVGDGPTIINFSPYARFLLKGKSFKPIIQGMFYVSRYSSSSDNSFYSQPTSTQTGLSAMVGGVYYVTPTFGIVGLLTALDIPFYDGGALAVGITGSSIGIEWFFD